MTTKYRVVQWGTGQVGRRALPALIDHPELDLVGVWVHSPEKVGKDAGEIAGCAPSGIAATNDVEATLDLAPDCVLYAPQRMDVGLVIRMLERGINVVTTCAGYVTGTTCGRVAGSRSRPPPGEAVPRSWVPASTRATGTSSPAS
jgi:hypothetical protein